MSSRSSFEKEQARQRKAAEKAAKERQRQAERQRKADEKLLQQAYLDGREHQATNLNLKIEKEIEALKTILETKLKKNFSFDALFAELTKRDIGIPPTPLMALLPPPLIPLPPPPIAPNRETFEAQIPKAGLVEKTTGLGRSKRAEQYEQIREAYQKAVQNYKEATEAYKQKMLAFQFQSQERERVIESNKALYNQKLQERQQAIQHLEAQLRAKNAQLVERYFQLVLEKSEYPESFPAKQFRLSYNPETYELVLEYDLPQYDRIIPAFKGYKYVKTSDKIEGIALSQTDERKMQELYEDVIAAIALGTLYELYATDHMDALTLVTFNGMVTTVDKATGKDSRPCLVSAQVRKGDFSQLQLARVDKKACLKHLKAQISPSPKERVPIRPLVEIMTEGSYFTRQTEILPQNDPNQNLLEMSPGEFERLIAYLFTKMGYKAETTPLSGDGGVDIIAYDDRPLIGGKIIIQAKLYSHTVAPDAVRALYGIMQDQGATKGILVTTGKFGNSSYKFAEGKPIELVDGNKLLRFLEEQGFQAKIEIPNK
jgi:restriction system protein